eukprot:5596842-Pyramimonas_sp.AAC.1
MSSRESLVLKVNRASHGIARRNSLLPHVIGPRYGHIPSSLARLASVTGIFPPPSRDWSKP